MLTLQRGRHHALLIAPRWPSTRIQLEEEALQHLLDAQALLPAGLGLLVTRGFEPSHSWLGSFRRGVRWLGIAVFRACYPQRHDEVDAIFGANGHDIDGRHIDVSVVLHGKRLRLLPLDVFTPAALAASSHRPPCRSDRPGEAQPPALRFRAASQPHRSPADPLRLSSALTSQSATHAAPRVHGCK